MHSILFELDKHPEERDLIGRIILGYGVLEVSLLHCVKAALNSDMYTANRVLYRLKSESNRLEVADALVRHKMAAHKLESAWSDAYGAYKLCKNIRNTYAHSTWMSAPDGTLRFGDMEKAAKTPSGKSEIQFRPLTKRLLEKQFAYFSHSNHLILWAVDQYQKAAGLPRRLPDGQYVIKPKRTPPPKLDSRGEARSRQ